MSYVGPGKALLDLSTGSGHTFATSRHQNITNSIASKRVCFYKSGDPQFNGLPVVINNRTFKTFDALLDSLSKRVPLPFGVRNITTPRGIHAVHNLDELEDGKAYICSDKRKIKPINLALANKKSPPWYHARPLSAHRQAIQKTSKQESGFFRTPKRLVVFRNGDTTVKHTVILRKKTTPTFRSLLDYMSELMQFPVVKLHTLDGRRVDGLPALIMCSGTVVAAGRESFKYGNYNIPAPTWLPPSRISSKRRKTVKRKKKSMSSGSKSRNFSSSSERHFVNQIHNSIAGSLCDLPRNPSGSVELETNHMLESVAETEGDTCLGDAEGSLLPTDDDIEKSFRVNQDGSMTVEMKVRLTIKEEETISWTTTLTRSSAANQTSVAESVSENSSPDSSSTEPRDSSTTDPVDIRHNPKDDDDDDDPPSMDYGIVSGEGHEEDSTKIQSEVTFPKRAATPGPRGISKRQAPVEGVTKEEVEESMVGSYSYRENMVNGAVTEQYCLVRQCNTRPVPKPRGGPTDNNTRNHRNPCTFQSEEGAEVLQIKNREEETRETVVHIYEQQSCHDNYLANSHFSAQGMYGLRRYDRPATADTARLSSSNDYETEQRRPSTTSESVNPWREENISLYSDLTLSSLNTRGGNIPSTKPKVMHSQKFPLSKRTKDKTSEGLTAQSRKSNYPQKVKKAKQVSPKKKVKKNISQRVSPEKITKDRHAEVHENRKKVQVRFSSTASIRKIYGYRPKPVKSLIMLKKKKQEKVDRSLATTSPTLSSNTSTFIISNQSNITPVLNGNSGENKHFETNVSVASLTEGSEACGILTGNKSVYEKGKTEKENSSMIANNDYVENWLEKVGPISTEEGPEGKMQNGEIPTQIATREDIYDLSDVTCKVISTAEMPSPLDKEKSLNCPSLENVSSSSLLKKAVIHEKVSSENPLLSLELTLSANNTQSISDKILLKKDSTEDVLHYNGQPNALENSLLLNKMSLPYDISTGLQSDSCMEKDIAKSMTLMDKKEITSNINLPKTTPLQFETSVEKPPQSERVFDASSVGSQCYMLPSKNKLFSDDSMLSITPPSNEAPAPTNRTSLNTEGTSFQREVSLSSTASVKKGRLVSNISFERKMSLQKALSDKSAITTESPLESAVSSSPVDVPMVTLSNDLPSHKISLPTSMSREKITLSDRAIDVVSLTSSSSLYMSASSGSLTSEERALPVSPHCIEVPSPSNSPLDGVIAIPTSSNSAIKEDTPSPKLIKKAKLSHLSLEKKPSLGKASSEKSKLPVVTVEKARVPGSPSLLRDKSFKTFHNVSLDKATSPTRKEVALNNNPSAAVEQNGSPSKGQSPSPRKSRMISRLSPYSQSLDVASPPLKIKSKTKSLTKNHSFDNMSEASNLLMKKTPSPKKRGQTKVLPIPTSTPFDSHEPIKAEQEKENNVNKSDNNADENAIVTKQSLINIRSPPQSPKMAAQPTINPVLERLCHSIKSIRNITHTKRGSCLEKSNSMPDFSFHVASTFGSSSKALLAFLSVMTLKEGITNSDIQELKANRISGAEALQMLECLREIANIEDANELKASLANLQKSTSTQLLQSWKDFQDLNDKYNILSPSPIYSEQELEFKLFPEGECSIMENSIDKLINELDVPEKLKGELAAFSVGIDIENDKLERCPEVIDKVESVTERNVDTTLPWSIKEENPSKLPIDSNVDVKSIISRFKKLNQANEMNDNLLPLSAGTPNMKRSFFKSEPNVKHIHGDTQAKERSFQLRNSGCEEPETITKQLDQNEEKILYEKLLDKMESNIPERSSHKDPQVECMDMKASNEEGMTSPEKDHSISNKEKPDIECKELGMSTEESLSLEEYENSDEKEDDFTSYTESVLEKFVDEENVTNNEEDQCSSEEEQCVFKSGELQVNDKKGNSIPDTHSEERDNKLLITTNSMGFNDGTEESMSSPDVKDRSSSVEDQPEVEYTVLPVTDQNYLFNCSPDKEEHNPFHTNDSLKCHISCEEGESSPEVYYQSETEDPMELKIIPEESTFTLEGDKYFEEEEQKCHSENQTNEEEHPWMSLQVSREYSETTPDHVTDGSGAESHPDDLGYPDSEMCFEQTEKDKLPTECEMQMSIMKEQEKYLTKAKLLSLTTHSSTAEEHYSFDIDQDSGNDRMSCEEHATDVNQTYVEDHPFGTEEDEIGYDDKRSSLEEEHYVTTQSVEESCETHQEHYTEGKLSEEESNHDVTKEKPTFQSETKITQSVADRVNLLEKKVTSESQRKREMLDNSRSRRVGQGDVACLSSSAMKTSTPQPSSLAFNYDCHGIITSQPEGNMVRSIKEMFLAKTVDSQNGQKRFPSPSTSDLSDYKPETSESGGYRSQTSSEFSSGEDDTARRSIVKGFVRRTIERLYGKKGDSSKALSNERPPSASKHEQKESASIFSPFHAAQTKMMPDLSYFNANHPFESFSEPTRCVAFNAKVGPGDSVSIDQGRWLIRESNVMRKSISDPIGINKNLESQKNKKMCENAKEDAPYSHFSVKSDQEEKLKFAAAKCTYFSLPNGSDSDVYQDDLSTESKSNAKGDNKGENEKSTEDPKTGAERNVTLTAFSAPDFKKLDNKVHPMVESPPDGQVVVVQPVKGQTTVVNRRPQEPDALEMLYVFCGQHCPVLS